MSTAPETVAEIWLNHLTLGPIRVEGRRGRWYAPNAARQVWRWYRSAEPDALEPFSGWLPVEALEEAFSEEARAPGMGMTPSDERAWLDRHSYDHETTALDFQFDPLMEPCKAL